MTKREMVAQIARNTGISAGEVTAVIDLYKELIKAAVRTGEPLQVKGLGTFTKKTRPARECFSPLKGEKIKLQAKDYVAFKQSSAFFL